MRREEIERVRSELFRVEETPTLRLAYTGGATRPVAECLACGHDLPLAVWKDAPFADVTHGLCEPCRDAAAHLRGPCSPERGCSCERRAA